MTLQHILNLITELSRTKEYDETQDTITRELWEGYFDNIGNLLSF